VVLVLLFLRSIFVQQRQERSPIRFAHGELRDSAPNHPTLAPQTLQSILRQAQLTVEQFKDALCSLISRVSLAAP
jgi:predicted RNA binding protein YcfA (HicA-like mRNA interferase family)